MKACFVFALLLVVAYVSFAQGQEVLQNEEIYEPVHVLHKRQLNRPSCQLWECTGNCVRRGFRGGYCAFTGCSCYI